MGVPDGEIMSMLMRALGSALISIVAVLLSFGVMYGICTGLGVDASSAILAAALTVGLMRRPEKLGARALAAKFLKLPLIALVAGAIGLALLKWPIVGALLFTGGITLSVLLRRYGSRARSIGSVLALSLMSILVVPVHIDIGQGRWTPPALMVAAGLISLASTVVMTWLAASMAAADREPPYIERGYVPRAGEIHIATRMALQMLAAMSLAFALGLALFPTHWAWVVLTAFIVCSGTVDRGDAVYKGLLRLAGAIGGAVLAALVAQVAFPNPASYATAVFFILFLGIWLRQINYAYWAAAATLIFALLQGSHGADILPLLGMRLACIVIGALCGVAATWLIYPIRSDQLARKRVAEALTTLRDMLAHKPGSPEHAVGVANLEHHAAELERLAPPHYLHRRVFGASEPDQHPATWIRLMRNLLAQARSPDFDRAQAGAEMRRLGAMLKVQTPTSSQKLESSDSASGK